jgi:hypothetical protein
MAGMRIAPGRVVGGRVEFDGELPEGAAVAVLTTDGDGTFEVDAETKRVLLAAIAQCRNGQTTPMAELLADLRRRG